MRTLPFRLLMCFLLSLAARPDVLAHEYYVSLGEFRYNEERSCFELSLRIFPDDMDRALEDIHGTNPMLLTRREHSTSDSLLALYFRETLELTANGKALEIKFLGKEAESDAMWCYLESTACGLPEQVVIRNAILTEVFADQVNICQVYVGEQNRGLLLNRDQPSGELKFRATSRGR